MSADAVHGAAAPTNLEADLAAFRTLTGFDANSKEVNPGFLDIDGADNVFGGLDTQLGGGKDDNFELMRNSPAIDSSCSRDTARFFVAACKPSSTFARSNGCRAPLRFTTTSGASSMRS